MRKFRNPKFVQGTRVKVTCQNGTQKLQYKKMICYYRNDISCGANRREFEDQSVIKGKSYQIGIRPIRVSHLRILEGIS